MRSRVERLCFLVGFFYLQHFLGFMDKFYQQVVASQSIPGVKVTEEVVRDVWDAVCKLTEDILLTRSESVLIPGLCTVVTQDMQSHSGTWNVRHSFVPNILLASAFATTFNVKSSVLASQAHVGSRSPVLVGPVLIAEKMRNPGAVPRHAVADVLKALIRCVGLASLQSGTVTCNLGVAAMDFSGGRMAVRWSRSFIERFEATRGLTQQNTTAVHDFQRRKVCESPNGASIRPHSCSQSPRRGLQPQLPSAPSPRSVALVPVPPAPLSSRPPSGQASQGITPLDARLVGALSLPSLPSAVPNESSAPSPTQSADSQRQLSPFHRHKYHKLAVRRQRKKAFIESWTEQERARERERLEAAAASKKEQEQFVQRAQEAEAAAAADRARRLAMSIEVKKANMDAAVTHPSYLIPQHEPMTALIQESSSKSLEARRRESLLEKEIREQQMQEKLTARKNEQLTDKEFGERLARDAAAYKEQTASAARHRRDNSRTYCAANEQHAIAAQRSLAQRLAERAKDGPAPVSLTMDCDGSQRVERHERSAALKERQKQFYNEHHAACAATARAERDAVAKDAAAVQRFIDKTVLLHEYESKQAALQCMENRDIWHRQAVEKKARALVAAEQEAKTHAVALFRNESSDDEEL